MYLSIDCLSLVAQHATVTTALRLKRAVGHRGDHIRPKASKALIVEGVERLGIVPKGRGGDFYNALFPSEERSKGIWLVGEFLLWIIQGFEPWPTPPTIQIYTRSMARFVSVIARLEKIIRPTDASHHPSCYYVGDRIAVNRVRHTTTTLNMVEYFDSTLHFAFEKVYYSRETGLMIRDLYAVWNRTCVLHSQYYLESITDLSSFMDENLIRLNAEFQEALWKSRDYSTRHKRKIE